MGFLLEEQYTLCCYSELRADQAGLGYHIEHVENKSQAPQRTFDFANLAASALHSDHIPTLRNTVSPADRAVAVFGGHAPGKQAAVNMNRFVSPHQPDCARFFAYLSDGRVVPQQTLDSAERARAQYTIDLLNLNSPFLQNERQRWWDELDMLYSDHLDQDMDLECLAAVDLVPRNQTLHPFFSLTRQFFGQVAERVIQRDAPELV